MGLDRHQFGGFRVKARALRLRQVDGAFSFICSHIASLKAILVRVRSVLIAPGVPVVEAISNWQIAIGQMVESYFFFLGLRFLCGAGTLAGAFVLADCFL